jgi:hypothetical protein
MGFWDFAGKWAARSGRLFGADLDAPFDPSTGHSHDGTNSKAIAAGAADDSTLTLTEGVFAVKAGGIVASQLGVTAGTAAASKALVLGADKNVDTIAIAESGLKIGSGAGTAVTGTAVELNTLAGVTAGTVAASKAVVVSADKDASAFRNVTVVNLDAGASGTAGTVDVFPATASKGKLAIACANQTGNTTVTVTAAAMGQATAIGIPDPGGASADVVLTAGAQTIAGVKTFSAASVLASGTTIGTVPVIVGALTTGAAIAAEAGVGNTPEPPVGTLYISTTGLIFQHILAGTTGDKWAKVTAVAESA